MSILVSRTSARQADPLLDDLLRGAILLGVLLVVLIPGARGHSATVGWWPLWLLGMPLASWWALHGFGLPWCLSAGRTDQAVQPRRRPRDRLQARRRSPSVTPRRQRAA